ncbi:MAG: hypothetical protein RQ757_03755 [Pseudomonadales bacterium]|nr:hypothetical protein [Pseudomonadales bacterium]
MNLMMMRSAKTLATALLLAMISGTPALAQNTGMQNPEARIKQLIEVLEISAEQEPAFREAMAKVNAQQREAMQAMRQQAQEQRQNQTQDQNQRQGQGREMMMARQAELQKATEEALTPVLSTAQMAKFREYQSSQAQQQRRPMREMRQGQQGQDQGQRQGQRSQQGQGRDQRQ